MGFLLNENATRLLAEDAGRLSLEQSTWMYLVNSVTTGLGHDAVPLDMKRDMSHANNASLSIPLTASGSNVQALVNGTDPGVAWYSERIAQLITVSALAFRHYATMSSGADTAGTIRVRVWVIGSGPEHEERLVGDATAGTLPVAAYTQAQWLQIPVTPSPLTLSPGERLAIRITGEPIPSTTMEDGEITLYFNGDRGTFIAYDVALIPADDLTFVSNMTRLFLRRTTATGIGVFQDLLPTAVEQARATAVVNTSAGQNAQWTQTAGGSVVEWVSPRFNGSWYFQNITIMVNGSPLVISRIGGIVFALASNTLARASFRADVFRRRNGVETKCVEMMRDATAALSTSYDPVLGVGLTLEDQYNFHSYGSDAANLTPMDFQPDDRLVLRAYLDDDAGGAVLVGGYTATIGYDGTDTQSFIDIVDASLGLKAESDPDTPPTVPGADMMSGIGN